MGKLVSGPKGPKKAARKSSAKAQAAQRRIVRGDEAAGGARAGVGASGSMALAPERGRDARALARRTDFTDAGLSVCSEATGLIGRTPLLRLQRVGGGEQVWAKAEFKNPGGSVKDRPALGMILAAEVAGDLAPGATIVEATSGNTGISLAMIARVRGYRCVLVMPEDMSLERRYVLAAYGAEIILTGAQGGMSGAVERAHEIVAETRSAFMPSQFDNPNNPLAHELTTGPEIIQQCPQGVGAFVVGVGTGGTITGVGRALRARFGKTVRIVAVEPVGSAVLRGGSPGLHGIQGLGAGFIPKNLDRSLLDEIIAVSDVAAQRMCRRLAAEEGLLVGPSSGANVHAACQVAASLPGQTIVTVLCDSGERYLF